MNFTDAGVYGADVSMYQDNNNTVQQIDFSKMVGQGASFVIIRGGQNVWIDPDFKYNWSIAKQAGLPRGAYWFYDDRVSPITQAILFSDLFASDKPEMEVWLDIETDYGGGYGGSANWKKFIVEFKRMNPDIEIGIYTGYYYITGKIPASDYTFYAVLPLWLAWYTQNVSIVKIPTPWSSCLYWQWGTPPVGKEWGCESIELDMNKFNGTKDDFNTRYKLSIPLPPEEKMTYLEVTATALNGRPTPADVTINYPSGFLKGDILESNAKQTVNGTDWYSIAKQTRAGTVLAIPQPVWCSAGSTYGYLKILPPPTPTPAHTVDVYIDGVLDYHKDLF